MKQNRARRFTRRGFLRGAGALTVLGVAEALLACGPLPEDDDFTGGIIGDPVPTADQYPHTPFTPAAPPDRNILRSFSFHEARTVDALTATLLPGTPDDPGAREAGVVNYIDNLLSWNGGVVQPTYLEPPFARTYQGDAPPEDETSEQYQFVWVAEDQIERYGPQTALVPASAYRAGIHALDAYARQQFDAVFADLDEDQQEQIVADLAGGDIDTFDSPTALDFFTMVRQHTIEGMFGDPVYGGNQDMVGWRLIGYPGAQRAYTPADMATEGWALEHQPQSIMNLHQFHPGEQVDDNVIVPIQLGEDPQEP